MAPEAMKIKADKNMNAQIQFATNLPEPGNYRIFTQFQHEGKVITTDYTITVQ